MIDNAETAVSKARKSEAEDALTVALTAMSSDYMSDYYENDLDFDEKTIEDYFSYEEVNDELEDSDFILCNIDGERLTRTEMNKSVVGETIYLMKTTSSDKIIYQADIVKDGSYGVRAENFEIVE